ncbi:ELWxxDGT repeat protein [Kordia sp. SMS9]|uniref:ELWxxDGT repeat protein n=1 Tax=Kordia sp. SMS9 TaxID=2282170 RepID=UPI000E0DA05F|nr:ELWxxDGT repeat protein [Kordia sp. SMS9]AXG72247.1 ELWxxDGT repeat protein [Kordia sp. SMS9]
MKKSYLLKYFILFIFNLSIAQTTDATLVELNFYQDSHPQQLTPFQSGFYFTATDGFFEDFGRELWYCDGTPSGISMVKDIRPGDNSSDPSSLVLINDILYFTAYDGVNGNELWKSDGTEAGTVMVKDIRPNDNSEYNGPTDLIAFNGSLYFTATNNIDGTELWKSDGTEAGTVMVKDINQSPNGSSIPSELFIFNNALYFRATNGIDGFELWKSDGTEAGTVMVKDINTNNSSIDAGNQFLILNNNFYFYATDGINGLELWKSDGTETGTVMVKNIRASVGSSAFRLKGSVLNNLLIFEANDGINGLELWKSDGTEAGTSMISNINGVSASSISGSSRYITYNNEVYFLANDNTHGIEIWKTDGTEVGTTLLKDINPGNLSVWIEKFHVDEVNNKLLFFTTSTNTSVRTLWGSDGSSAGTFQLSTVRDTNSSGIEENFISINNMTILTGENDVYGNELWSTDGTIGGTSFFADMNYSDSSFPSKFTDINGNLFFRARGVESGNQLFKSDGTVSGTQLVKDINPGGNCIDDLSEMKEINGTLFFSAINGVNGYELWKSDGTESGTVMVKDINPGSQSSMRNFNDKQPFTVINDILYFYANDGVNGFELWRSDGTDAGTFMIKDIHTGGASNHSYPRSFVVLNNTIYFIASDNTGTALWTTDGTEAGTLKIINLNDMRVLTAVNNKLIIVAETSGTTYGPHDLWVSDGTAAGTSHLQSFGDGSDSSIQFTTTLNNDMYFVAKNPITGRKSFYKTDGTVAGTALLYDGATHPTITNVDIDNIITCGGAVYFGIQDNFGFDEELWRTDGVTTIQIAGSDTPDFSYIRNMTCHNNNLLYLAESYPKKIWAINDNITDAVHINVNILNSSSFEGTNAILELGSTANNLYFSGRNNRSGIELYITNVDASTLSIADYTTESDGNIKLVRAFPNPANGFVTIASITSSKIEQFEIWDLSGKKLGTYFNKNLKTEITYDVGHLNTGIYLVKATLSDGKITNLKLIVN